MSTKRNGYKLLFQTLAKKEKNLQCFCECIIKRIVSADCALRLRIATVLASAVLSIDCFVGYLSLSPVGSAHRARTRSILRGAPRARLRGAVLPERFAQTTFRTAL